MSECAWDRSAVKSRIAFQSGDYANHDEHWHPPYFDPYALAEDLDVVAVKLAPGLDRAFALADEPGLFDDALAEIDRGIASYPDSVQMNEDVCTLGPHATTCALRWIWLGLATKPQQALWTGADDWPAVFAAFADFRSRGGEAAAGEKLFGAWRAWEVDACTPYGEPPVLRGVMPSRS